LRLLEVGCGDGKFLDAASKAGWESLVGIDLVQDSVDICLKKGHEAHCCDGQDLIDRFPHFGGKFDCIAGFHVLEHVPDPVSLVDQALPLLKPDGALFLSFPYSPNDCECQVYDPRLYPPHHLTRWSMPAILALGNRFGLETICHFSRPRSLMRRLSHSLFCRLRAEGRNWSVPARFIFAMRHPITIAAEVLRQMQRMRVRIQGQTVSDHVLIEFKVKRGLAA
jgi:SAM-dependent methyltransferase